MGGLTHRTLVYVHPSPTMGMGITTSSLSSKNGRDFRLSLKLVPILAFLRQETGPAGSVFCSGFARGSSLPVLLGRLRHALFDVICTSSLQRRPERSQRSVPAAALFPLCINLHLSPALQAPFFSNMHCTWLMGSLGPDFGGGEAVRSFAVDFWANSCL